MGMRPVVSVDAKGRERLEVDPRTVLEGRSLQLLEIEAPNATVDLDPILVGEAANDPIRTVTIIIIIGITGSAQWRRRNIITIIFSRCHSNITHRNQVCSHGAPMGWPRDREWRWRMRVIPFPNLRWERVLLRT